MALVPHDYLDDLEGFFLVLAHIMLAFEAPGVWKRVLPLMGLWLTPMLPEVLAIIKKSFIREGISPSHLSDWWGDACINLLLEFGKELAELLVLKAQIHDESKTGEAQKKNAEEKLAEAVQANVDKIKAAFEVAIATLVKEGPAPEELNPYPQLSADYAAICDHFPLSGVLAVPPLDYHDSAIPLHNFESQGTKRGSEENEDEGEERKRLRKYRSPLSETADFDNETTQDDDSEGDYEYYSDSDN